MDRVVVYLHNEGVIEGHLESLEGLPFHSLCGLTSTDDGASWLQAAEKVTLQDALSLNTCEKCKTRLIEGLL